MNELLLLVFLCWCVIGYALVWQIGKDWKYIRTSSMPGIILLLGPYAWTVFLFFCVCRLIEIGLNEWYDFKRTGEF